MKINIILVSFRFDLLKIYRATAHVMHNEQACAVDWVAIEIRRLSTSRFSTGEMRKQLKVGGGHSVSVSSRCSSNQCARSRAERTRDSVR
jgi:hypothetical protein